MAGTTASLVMLATAAAYRVRPDHPRIFITKDDLPELVRRATGPLAREYSEIRSRADRAVGSGVRFISNRFAMPQDLMNLGLAYLVERELGRGHRKYADAAAREMKKWLKPRGRDCHFGYHAVCYDWVYDGLSDADRTELSNRLGSWLTWYTGSPTIKLKWGHWEYNQTWGPSHMNTMHCRDGITNKTFIALAIHGAPTGHQKEAEAWLDSCCKRIPTECIPAFERMGADWYGLMRPWSYLPEETAWVSHLMYPFNDHTAWIDDNQAGRIGAYLNCAPMLARAFGDPVAVYWSNRGLKEKWSDQHWTRFVSLPTDVAPRSPAEAGYPLAWFFRGAGHVYMRSAWDDPNATWASFGVGPFLAGHSRDDEGHFMICRRGHLVARQGAGAPGHYYDAGSLIFNIVTVYNPGEQMKRTQDNPNDGGLKRCHYNARVGTQRGRIVAYEHNPHYTYAAGDVTRGYSSKVRELTRQFLYLRGPQEFFVVFDRVQASNPAFPKHFMLHVPTEPRVAGTEKVLVPGHVAAYGGEGLAASWESSTEDERDVRSRGKSRIFMRTLLPGGAVITKRGGRGHVNWGHPSNPQAQRSFGSGRGRNGPVCDWRLEVAAPVGQARQYFLHVFFVTDGPGPMPRTSAEVRGNQVVVRIEGSPRRYEVGFALAGVPSGRVVCEGQGGYASALATRLDFSTQPGGERPPVVAAAPMAKTRWKTPAAKPPPSPEANAAIEEARKLARAGRFEEAVGLLAQKLAGAKTEAGREELEAARQAYAAVPDMRSWAIDGVAAGRREKVYVQFMGRPVRAVLVGADEEGIDAEFAGSSVRIAWEKISARRLVGILRRYQPPDPVAERALAELVRTLGMDDGR